MGSKIAAASRKIPMTKLQGEPTTFLWDTIFLQTSTDKWQLLNLGYLIDISLKMKSGSVISKETINNIYCNYKIQAFLKN